MELKSVNLKDTGLELAGTFLGIIGGSYIDKAITENKTVEGLAGEAKDYIVPTIVTVGGAILSASVKNKFVKSVGFGVSCAGGAKIVNRASGKQVVSLGSVNNNRVRRIPQRMRGIGYIKELPAGMGRTFNQPGSAIPGMSGTVGLL